LWYRASIGMNTIVAIMIEWKGPRCTTYGIKMSTSGITESRKIRATLTLVFVALDVSLARMYPRAKWPTAYVDVSSNARLLFRLINMVWFRC